MNSLKPIVGLASIAALFFAVTHVAHGATVALRPSADTTTQLPAASVQGPSCPTPYSDAAIAGTSFFEMPPTGALAHFMLEQSSGNFVLDDSALRTARMTKYVAETQNCVAIPGSYLLKVDF